MEEIEGIKKNELLSNHCTFRIGGPADFFYIAKSSEEIPELIAKSKAENMPYFILGGGSNVLFDDKGFRGLVIKIESNNKPKIHHGTVTADAGVKISELMNAVAEQGYSGFEKWIGLPGTVGGAVRGNAGCNGLETKDILIEAEVFDPETMKTDTFKNKDFKYDYRESSIKGTNKIVLSAKFKLGKGTLTTQQREKILAEIRKNRYETQPPGFSSGSFFKNPSPENPAGMLIDQAGLKGTQIGKARISPKHANFFQNRGGATAKDILALAQLAKEKVKDKFGIELEEEVQIIDENGNLKTQTLA